MTPADILRAARLRFFNGNCPDPAAALRVDGVEFTDYTRALFILKRAFGVSPDEPIFVWYRREKPRPMDIEISFGIAIALAEAA